MRRLAAERELAAVKVARDRVTAERDADRERAATERAELERQTAITAVRLRAERAVGVEALLELARADGRVAVFSADPRALERLRRIGRDSLCELAAELAELPKHFAAHGLVEDRAINIDTKERS